MINIYQNGNKYLELTDKIKPQTWINLIDPTIEEIEIISKETGALVEFISAPLDMAERPRIDIEEEQTLIIISTSHEQVNDENEINYRTIPVGIIFYEDYLITVCRRNLKEFDNLLKVKNLDITNNNKFISKISLDIATSYLKILNVIQIETNKIESLLKVETKKQYFLHLLSLEKTLVYFNNALNANEILLNKLFRFNQLDYSKEDLVILEDIIIEMKQAGEMAKLNGSIISSIRQAFESISNNNLNVTMKSLATITIVINIPMLVTSFFGMNLAFPQEITKSFLFIYILVLIMIIITYIFYRIMRKRNLF